MDYNVPKGFSFFCFSPSMDRPPWRGSNLGRSPGWWTFSVDIFTRLVFFPALLLKGGWDGSGLEAFYGRRGYRSSGPRDTGGERDVYDFVLLLFFPDDGFITQLFNTPLFFGGSGTHKDRHRKRIEVGGKDAIP
jgi:hypothetical protein